MSEMRGMAVRQQLLSLLEERILVFDGAMGTMIQAHGLTESDFRGERFKDHAVELKGNNDILCITRPDVILGIHEEYLKANCDIIETNTFSSNFISQGDYGLQECAYEMNVEAAKVARQAAMKYSTEDKPRFVAGSIGPTTRSCSMSTSVDSPGERNVTFSELVKAFRAQVRGLIDGGADILLVETVFDTLNCKAAIYAIEDENSHMRLPVIVSGTVDSCGRTLSGQTVEAFLRSVRHCSELLSIGLNCSLGAKQMRPFLSKLNDVAGGLAIHAYPNAGLPNAMGEYDQSPEEMATLLKSFCDDGLLNICGGCCGTSPGHIREISKFTQSCTPRDVSGEEEHLLRLAGLEELIVTKESNFLNVGERCNVAGSRAFKKLIVSGNYEKAVEVARKQVDNGAQIIDINVDDGLIDGPVTMRNLLNMMGSDPEVSRVPVMIDSSRISIVEAGLQCTQGKCVVNSLSLKEGEEALCQNALMLRKYGAAVVIMAFDEKGQAVSAERKVEICKRAYKILTSEKVRFPPEDIIFDPNILTIGTGIHDHDNYAVEFLDSVRQIKETLPYCHVSGGVSNLSFAFRGLQSLREAMHCVFLYHAIAAGMDMGIVNAGALPLYDSIDPKLLGLIEDVILNKSPDAGEKLLAEANQSRGLDKTTHSSESVRNEWRQISDPKERLKLSLIKGNAEYIDVDVKEVLEIIPDPLNVIEGPLMEGMKAVGEMFGTGKLFLPQVIKSARVMKNAVSLLERLMDMDGTSSRNAATIVLATVKGDVHDIGKDIVGVVLQCNGFRIVDAGVMTPCEKILQVALEEKADIIGLSGLITPSLEEMIHVAKEMERNNMRIPLLIGGATTSKLHTAVKIASAYPHGLVVHVPDASNAAGVCSTLLDASKRGIFEARLEREYEKMEEMFATMRRNEVILPLSEVRQHGIQEHKVAPHPKFVGKKVFRNFSLEKLIPFIDWDEFFRSWGLHGRGKTRTYPKIFDDKRVGDEAKKIHGDAVRILDDVSKNGLLQASAVFGIFRALREGDDIHLYDDEQEYVLHGLRQQAKLKDENGAYLCISDFVSDKEEDYMGLFAVSAGFGVDEAVKMYNEAGNSYDGMLLKTIATRLAEAFSERLHQLVRCEYWGYSNESCDDNFEGLKKSKHVGIRPAAGYPQQPDHTEKETIWRILNVEETIGIRLTESYAMDPLASACGMYFASPSSKHFGVGKIGKDQVHDYAKRKQISIEECERWLSSVI